MLMQAVVIEVQRNRLIVLDLDTRQRVIVNTPDARFYRPGDTVRIWYNGVMTKSLPPQIYALSINPMPANNFPPSFPPVRPPARPPVRPPALCPHGACRPVIRPPVPPIGQLPPLRPSPRG